MRDNWFTWISKNSAWKQYKIKIGWYKIICLIKLKSLALECEVGIHLLHIASFRVILIMALKV